jgi:hypothetical protein
MGSAALCWPVTSGNFCRIYSVFCLRFAAIGRNNFQFLSRRLVLGFSVAHFSCLSADRIDRLICSCHDLPGAASQFVFIAQYLHETSRRMPTQRSYLAGLFNVQQHQQCGGFQRVFFFVFRKLLEASRAVSLVLWFLRFSHFLPVFVFLAFCLLCFHFFFQI